jgi:uncharacterized protein (DUF697 family)
LPAILFLVFGFSTTDLGLEVLRGVETVAASVLAASIAAIVTIRTTWTVKEPVDFDMIIRGPVAAGVFPRGNT